MKKINIILSLIVIAFTISCDSDPDNIGVIADNGGVIVNTDRSTGSILGAPAGTDLENAEVTFETISLNYEARMNTGSTAGITKFEVVKNFNGGAEVSVAETTSLPYNVEYTSIADYISGFSMAATDLRIGDEFTFRLKIHQADGDVYYYSPSMGDFTVVVNCSSSLAGMYDVTTVRDDGSTYAQGIEEIVEVSPGYYKTITTGGWGAGTIAPDQGYNFNDTCNIITVPLQDLCQGYYSNDVFGTDDGEVLANGNIIINYEIEFGSGNRTYTSTYIKQ